jgi:hypothetical protein
MQDINKYRVYYDEQGNIISAYNLMFDMLPAGDNYITVDRNVYENYGRYTVKDGELIFVPAESIIPEYRIYYDEEGNIIACAMVQHPEGDNYIVVSRDEYENYFRYFVRNGKLVLISSIKQDDYSSLIVKSDSGIRVVEGHSNLVLDDEEEYLKVEYYNYVY